LNATGKDSRPSTEDGRAARLVVRRGRDRPVRDRHPWIFSGAIGRVEGDPRPGGIVDVVDAGGAFLARGYYNPASQIVVRLLTWDDETIGAAWWRDRIERSVGLRDGLEGNAARLIHAENDFLPGLVVDRYGDWLVLQALTLGVECRKQEIAGTLLEVTGARGVWERSDVAARAKEGLEPFRGPLSGEPPPSRIEIVEGEVRMLVDVRRGHKTGAYLDQRPNRLLLGERARGAVLNLFGYTGGFGLHALRGGADRVVSVDSSREALELAEDNRALNGLEEERFEQIEGNVFELLRDWAAGREQRFDVVVLDPPKFAATRKQVDRAARGYKDLNLHAARCVSPGGLMMTFSCSGAVDERLFRQIVFGALADAGREAQILARLGPGEDHPEALSFPEGAYLKGLLLRVR